MLLRHRLPLIAVGALVIGGMLSGCAPSPAPTPTPTPAFASDEEAFAAAEEVYRAYNDAVNAQWTGADEASPLRYLSGDALETDIESMRVMEERGWSLVGDGHLAKFEGIKVDGSRRESVSAAVCLDIGAVRVLDVDGNDITPGERQERLPLRVGFTWSGSSLTISSSDIFHGLPC